MLNGASAIIVGHFLLIVEETSSQPVFGVFVHFVSTDLKLHNAFVGRDHGSVNGLVAVGFGHSDVVLDFPGHRGVE